MPEFFIPARNPRHRTACFALYKALLRQGAKIPLPDDLILRSGPTHPIKHLVRKGFRRNRTDTSQRLVIKALQNGYKFLNLLTAGQTSSSPAHSSILSFLDSRSSARKSSARNETAPKPSSLRDALRSSPVNATGQPSPSEENAAQQPLPPKEPRPRPKPDLALHPDRTPILTLVQPASKQGNKNIPPVYTATARPLPLSKLSGGIRKLPVLDECKGIPFLRLGKPQSHGLGRVLHQLGWRRQVRTTKASTLATDDLPDAHMEDQWEESVRELMEVEGQGGSDEKSTFAHSVRVGSSYLYDKLNVERLDFIARGKALWDIVEKERALAREERVDGEQRGDQ